MTRSGRSWDTCKWGFQRKQAVLLVLVYLIPIVWCLSTPHFIDATDEYGRHVYIASDGTVYSAYGDSVGVMVNHGEYIRY